ncbi:MAG TPA: cardiolipin synthase ClsB [Planctomycetes bacterium]|nr:cardiolipin synthase ClsB [Planctomycetota bacterium]
MEKRGTRRGGGGSGESSSERVSGAGRAGRGGGVGIEDAVRRVFAPPLESTGRDRASRRLAVSWRETLRQLFPLGHVSLDNRVRVRTDGDEAFEALWNAIDAARESLGLATYILEPDRVGRETLARLARAAERGVEVLLVVDAFGSHRLLAADLAPLRDAGAKVVRYNPLFGRRRTSTLKRLHQKILVRDGEQAFVGGLNFSEDYAGQRLGTGLFRDTLLEVEGPAARALDRLVRRAADEKARIAAIPDVLEGGGTLVEVLESNRRRHRRAIQRALRTTVRRAVQRCSLSTPYFVPPARLRTELCRAAERGVEVRILTAGRSDVRTVHLASQHIYGQLLRSGVRIFELSSSVLHAKTTAIDGVFATVGSFNLDHWSDRRNLEVSVCVLDRDLASRLEASFETDLEGAREVTLRDWEGRSLLQRILHAAAYHLMRL